jgi:hypothetical protein
MEAQAELTTVRQRLEQQIVANATMLGGLIDDSTTKLGCGTHHPQAPACLPACLLAGPPPHAFVAFSCSCRAAGR